jgi:hypothetical protein
MASPDSSLQALGAVSLEALDARAALLQRVDRKYLVPHATYLRLVEDLSRDHDVLEIDGRRAFGYESVYFDTPDLRCFREHVEDRSPRFKVRSRLYVDTSTCRFELKLKHRDGETSKEQLDLDPADHGKVTPEARRFLDDSLPGSVGGDRAPDLAPTLITRFSRSTLAARAGGERVTCDSSLELARPDGAAVRLDPEAVLIETKSETGDSRADRLLQGYGNEQMSLSKYRTGIGLLVAEDPDPPPGVEGMRWFSVAEEAASPP